MCMFQQENLLSAEDYQRGMEAVALLKARGISIISIIFVAGSDFDVLISPDSPVHELPEPILFAIVRGQEIWQTYFWGVRIRWIKPIPAKAPGSSAGEPKTSAHEEKPMYTQPPVPDNGFWSHIWKLLGIGHAH